MIQLPQTGTAELLELLSDYLDDELIEELMPTHKGPGPRPQFHSSQLFRVQLLNLLSPVHSFNLLVQLLAENRSWRDFARLPNKRALPDPKMLHEFRDRLKLGQLRRVNKDLLVPLLAGLQPARQAVCVIDSTDLPAPVSDFKKNAGAVLSPEGGSRGAHRQKRPEPVVHRL